MKFQDELESGKRPKKSGPSIQEQVELYRDKLLQRVSMIFFVFGISLVLFSWKPLFLDIFQEKEKEKETEKDKEKEKERKDKEKERKDKDKSDVSHKEKEKDDSTPGRKEK